MIAFITTATIKGDEIMADETYVYGIYDSGGKYAYADRITVDRSNERDAAAQLKAGGELRQPGEDGMHLIPRTGNGAKGEENLVAGSRSINRGSYKSMENSLYNLGIEKIEYYLKR